MKKEKERQKDGGRGDGLLNGTVFGAQTLIWTDIFIPPHFRHPSGLFSLLDGSYIVDHRGSTHPKSATLDPFIDVNSMSNYIFRMPPRSSTE